MIYQGDAWKYVEDTPEILSNIWAERDSILMNCIPVLTRTKVSELYLVGTGSSYHSAIAVASFLKKILGIRVFPVYPITVSEEVCFMNENSLIVGISQQGTSMAVIQALDEAKSLGIRTLSITGEYNTEITRHSHGNIYVECGYEDAGATTKGYTATVLTLVLFGLQLAKLQKTISSKGEESYQGRIKSIVENMPHVLENSRNWCKNVSDKLIESNNLIVLCDGIQKATMLEAVLKLSETCRFPVRGFELDAFMHGMYNAVDNKTDFLYLFPEEKEQRERMERLYEYYEKQGYHQYRMPENQFTHDSELSFLEEILPIQQLFVLTSRKKGINLNIPTDPDFHKKMGSKLEESNVSKG